MAAEMNIMIEARVRKFNEILQARVALQITGARRVTGWSAVWRMPKPDDLAITMGSVFVLALPDDSPQVIDQLRTLQEEGIGRRRCEGFGQLRVASEFHYEHFEAESVANDSMKVTDVFNYIKTRTARQSEWRDQNFGFDLLAYLEKDMGKIRIDLIGKLTIAPNTKESQEVYILLIREFVRQLAAQYEFALLKKEGD